MSSIILKAKDIQSTDFKLHGIDFVLKNGDNHIKIEDWLVIRKIVEKKISKGFVSINRNEETQAIASFQRECFAEFEQLGISAVKASCENGELSKGVKHTYAQEKKKLAKKTEIIEKLKVYQ